MDEQVTDDMLLAAIRQRILDEINRKEQQAQIINQIYGGKGGESPQGQAGGVMGALGNASGMSPEDYNYYVDISRQDVFDPQDPSRRIGWDKKVHRYKEPKKKAL